MPHNLYIGSKKQVMDFNIGHCELLKIITSPKDFNGDPLVCVIYFVLYVPVCTGMTTLSYSLLKPRFHCPGATPAKTSW